MKAIDVVGGVYREQCLHPPFDEIHGSGGRAAGAIASAGTQARLHAYVTTESYESLREREVLDENLIVVPAKTPSLVEFFYDHPLATPHIRGVPTKQNGSIQIRADNVLRFGMLEGDAVVDALWAVYDPQNGRNSTPFGANGSKAERLGLVVNQTEARYLAGLDSGDITELAAKLAKAEGAEVVVIKMGAAGAYVWTQAETRTIAACQTSRVWKIGSGDVFSAHFAHAWIVRGSSPFEAAELASRATAFFCETHGYISQEALSTLEYPTAPTPQSNRTKQIYLAGPFFDLGQLWVVNQARVQLTGMGLCVFSPYHQIGRGKAEVVVARDLVAIKESDVVLGIADGLDPGTVFEIGYARAIGKPVIVLSERQSEEDTKMMVGSGCVMCNDFTSAIYKTLWEAGRL